MFGSTNNIAYIDLTRRTIVHDFILDNKLLPVLGGRGLNSRLLLDEYERLSSPLDENNVIVVSAGLFVNTSAPSSGRTCISTLMNAEGTNFSDGNLGGRFSRALKSSGFDALMVSGKCSYPCYLLVDNECVQILPANELWLKTTSETEKVLKQQYPNSRVLSIGPAGAKLSVFSIVMHEDRAAGGSAGIVWGSKNLKAIVAIEKPTMTIAKKQVQFAELCRETEEYLKFHPLYEIFANYGTSLLVDIHNKVGNFPAKGWRHGKFDRAAKNVNHLKVEGRALPRARKKELFEQEAFGCYNCALKGCSHVYKDSVVEREVHKIEYEALNCLSAKIGGTSLEDVLSLNTWANDQGVDYIRLTSYIWAKGYLVLSKFKASAITSYRDFKDSFVDPYFKKNYIEIKGKALSSFDPRFGGSFLAAMTSTRGADHLRSLPTIKQYQKWYEGSDLIKWFGIPQEVYDLWKEKGALGASDDYTGIEYLVKYYQENNALADALGLCKFHSSWRFGLGFEKIAKLLRPLTGIDWKWQEVQEVGERIVTIERLLLQKYKQKDTLPDIFYEQDTESCTRLDRKKVDQILHNYYYICDYDRRGYPSQNLLRRLQLV